MLTSPCTQLQPPTDTPLWEHRQRTLVWSFATVLLVYAVVAPQVSARKKASPVTLDFGAVDLEGRPFGSHSLRGRVALVDFWAVWCEPCLAAIPTLNRLHVEGLNVLGVAVHSGSPEDVKAFVSRHGVEYPMVVGDEELPDRFGIVGYPTYLLIGPDGTIHKRYVGKIEELLQEGLEQDIAALRERTRRSHTEEVRSR